MVKSCDIAMLYEVDERREVWSNRSGIKPTIETNLTAQQNSIRVQAPASSVEKCCPLAAGAHRLDCVAEALSQVSQVNVIRKNLDNIELSKQDCYRRTLIYEGQRRVVCDGDLEESMTSFA